MQTLEKTAGLLAKITKDDTELREKLALINDLLLKHDFDEAELVMNKKHILDSYKEFADEVKKLEEIKKKQEARLKEQEAFTKKAVALVSGDVKKRATTTCTRSRRSSATR